jgi:uncharacterized tellurite resistance protein B-like protein
MASKLKPYSKLYLMQPEFTTPEEAVTHLFFHCCFRDGKMTGTEIEAVSEKLVAIGLNRELNFKDEVVRYESYKDQITDEAAYIENLVAHIHPTNELALFSFCVELCLSDGLLQAGEETLLHTLASALDLDESAQQVCSKLIVQRKVVEQEKGF